MNPTTDLRGIITVLNTPFNPDDTLDLLGLARNVENAIQAGVAGFLVPAMASEVSALSDNGPLWSSARSRPRRGACPLSAGPPRPIRPRG
jgi:hypothetical protein